MIIEFTGLPGCGKTYLASELVRRGLVKDNLIQKERTVLWYKVYCRLKEKGGRVFSKSYRDDLNRLKQAFADIDGKSSLGGFRNIEYDLNRIVFLKHIYAEYISSSSHILFDEGILQSFLNISAYFNADLQAYRPLIREFLPEEICCIQINVTPEESFRTIRERNRHVCDFDEMKDEELLTFLRRFEAAGDRIGPEFVSFCLDRGDALDDNIQTIRERLYQQ